MKVDPLVFTPAVDKLVTAVDPQDIATAITGVIDLCERALPHSDWALLRAIDYVSDIVPLRGWFDDILRNEPPETPLRGLYFAVCSPVVGEKYVTDDMRLIGTSEYDPADPDLDWIFTRHYFPEVYAESAALDELYGIAYRTHDFGIEVTGALGNDAEWPVGLAFAVLAARAIMEGRNVGELPTDAARVGVAAGWGEGDMLRIGEITDRGFVPPLTPRRLT